MPKPTRITYEFTDGLGDTTTMPSYYDPAVVDTVAKANAVSVVGSEYLNAISDAQVTAAYVEFGLTIDAGGAPAGRNDAGATMTFTNEQGYDSYSPFVPAIKSSLLLSVGNQKIVDEGGAGMGNFISFVTTGGGVTGGYAPKDRFLHDLETFKGGKQSVRKSSNV